MTGPEHYKEAEELLAVAADSEMGSDRERYHLAAAQVHATLAIASAAASSNALALRSLELTASLLNRTVPEPKDGE